MKSIVAILVLAALAVTSPAAAQPVASDAAEAAEPGHKLGLTGGVLIGVGLASAGTALILDRASGPGTLRPYDSRENDAQANMLDGGLLVAGVGVSLTIASWIVARDARSEDVKIDRAANGRGGLVRTRVAGNFWISPKGLHF